MSNYPQPQPEPYYYEANYPLHPIQPQAGANDPLHSSSYPPPSAVYPIPPAGTNGAECQQVNPETGSDEQETFSFSDKTIRRGFIRKVYLILMVQLLFTVGIICLFIFCIPVKIWVQSNPVAYYVSYAVFIVTYIILVCLPNVRRKVPLNYVALAIFTAALTYMAATISSFYDTYIVLIALGITAAVCLSISLFAIQTKIDFTMMTGMIFALCMVTFFFGLSLLITYCIAPNSFGTYVLSCVYGGLVALLMSMFLVFDTQMVVGGKHRKFKLSPEEYITGALQLYIDIVYIFLLVLSCFKN